MGTTIRREPVSFAIPKAPDYKFLNITNFGGIEKSSNPFVVSSNTASDCLNVYVDEDNALTTRPRVSIKHDIKKALSFMGDFEIIAVYPLHTGYLVHLRTDRPILALMSEIDGGIYIKHTLSGSNKVPLEKMLVFEQNNKIYLMGAGAYFYVDWDGDEILEVEPYIPTTTVGKNKTTKILTADGGVTYDLDVAGSTYESLNLLTDKYKETYFWDGYTNYSNTTYNDDYNIKNEYFKHKHDVFAEDSIVKIFAKTSDTDNDIYSVGLYGDTYSTASVDGSGKLLTSKKVFANASELRHGKFSSNGTALSGIVFKAGEGYFLRTYIADNSSDSGFIIIESEDPCSSDTRIVAVSDTGSHVVVTDSSGNINRDHYYVWVRYDGTAAEYSKSAFKSSDADLIDLPKTVYTNEQGTRVLLVGPSTIEYADISATNINAYAFTTIFTLDNGRVFKTFNTASFSPDNTKIITSYTYENDLNTSHDSRCVTLFDTTDFTTSQTTYMKYYSTPGLFLWVNNNKLYFKSLWEDLKYVDGVIRITSEGLNVVYGATIDIGAYPPVGYIATDTMIVGYSLNSSGAGSGISVVDILLNSSEPLVTIEYKLTDSDETAEVINKLKNAKLVQRFDNNMWFASGNYTFHTEYNNPSYIPLSSYNTLGEDYEEITGLSIVNDNILAAYKRNKIYIITPVTVGDRLTYSYTETKNVIGNDAVGAPILTILTEMPTIVSYDGIYALNQLENVQSGDRITTLISEAINPKWLKESKADIDKCMTLNRLYWTYYILPHEKISGENKSYTKIYLLDNRSQQWYYWELPLLCINAFVKDNKTHLVDGNGKIFTLETTDLEGANPSETEYYDMVDPKARVPKLLIPWHWYSQILSLNTMNYTKRLVDTTFIMTDTDTQDGYRLQYRLKAWRKSVSETENGSEITGNVHYVQSTTKRTAIPRFSFIQFKLDNYEDDLQNNKLRLVGLGLKYVLLEGLY